MPSCRVMLGLGLGLELPYYCLLVLDKVAKFDWNQLRQVTNCGHDYKNIYIVCSSTLLQMPQLHDTRVNGLLAHMHNPNVLFVNNSFFHLKSGMT